MTTRIKICGITRVDDAIAAVGAGADALGFVFYADSTRYIDPQQAQRIIARLPPFITTVGVLVNPTMQEVRQVVAQADLDVLQLHGDEEVEFCESLPRPYIKGVRVKRLAEIGSADAAYTSARALLVDTFVEREYGGTGESLPWEPLPGVDKPIILAGGLDAGNVAAAIRTVRPYAVDVSSGVEIDKGIKDENKIRCFVQTVKEVDD